MRRFCLLLALLLSFALPSGAESSSAPVVDSAGVLAESTLSDARRLAADVKEKSDVSLVVHLQHFLGGADVQAAANKQLNELPDQDNVLLLLAAVGEDSYALAAGSEASRKLNKDGRDNLLSAHFRLPFLAREYDRAVAAYLMAAASALTRGQAGQQTGGGLFEGALATEQPAQDVYRSITITRPDKVTEQPGAQRQRAQEQEKGLSIFSIVAIGLVLSAIFGKKDNRRGCGCGPLGWIFSVFGLAKIFGWRK